MAGESWVIPTDFIFLFIIRVVFFLWSELIRVQLYFIFIFLFDPSWSESIRVDPVRLLYLPFLWACDRLKPMEPVWVSCIVHWARHSSSAVRAIICSLCDDSTMGFIKGRAPGKVTGCEHDFARLLYISKNFSLIRGTIKNSFKLQSCPFLDESYRV